jgi:hypothetical protein
MVDREPQHSGSRNLDGRTVHLLNNHLGIILLLIELVLGDTPASDPRRRDLLEIKRAAEAAVALIAPNERGDR